MGEDMSMGAIDWKTDNFWSENAQGRTRGEHRAILQLLRLCHKRLSILFKFVVVKDVRLGPFIVLITLNASLYWRQIWHLVAILFLNSYVGKVRTKFTNMYRLIIYSYAQVS